MSTPVSMRMVKAMIGLTNINQDHYLRCNALDMTGDDVNALLLHQLGNSSVVSPSEVREMAARAGGVASTNGEMAYLEDGWAISRGLGYFEFDLFGESPVQSSKLGVYGYLHGGSVINVGDALPNEIMFTPTKSWIIETQAVSDHNGFINTKNVLNSANNILVTQLSLNGEGLHSIRPVDIVNNAVGLATIANENDLLSGGSDFGGSAGGALKTAGVIMSRASNDSAGNYAADLISAATVSAIEIQNHGGDPFSGIAASCNLPRLREISPHDCLFFRQMRRSVGMGSLNAFSGFSLEEIAMTFTNFGEVANTQLTDTDRFMTEDNRMDTDEHVGSSFQVLYSVQLNHLANAVMQKYRLSALRFRADNSVDSGQVNINGNPVIYQIGASVPIMDNDPDLEFNVVSAIEEILYDFYQKHNSAYFHERTQIAIDMNMSLFAESTVQIMLYGDESTTRTRTFGVFAGNRFSPNLIDKENMLQTTQAFYNNLKSYIETN